MGKLESALKSEIIRLARREARGLARPLRAEVRKLKKRNLELRHALSELVASVEKERANRKIQSLRTAAQSGQVKGRLSARLIKSMRSKLGLSQAKFARLAGASVPSIVNWESGKLQPNAESRARILALRPLKRRDVKKLL